MKSETEDSPSLDHLSLLASALSNRAIYVAPGEPGEPAWTDGKTMYVDPMADSGDRLQTIAVQSALLAAGSLPPNVLKKLKARRTIERRYLAVEGHRALSELEMLLPPSLQPIIDHEIASRVSSPAASLEYAQSRGQIADPPHNFGVIRAHKLLAVIRNAEKAEAASRNLSQKRQAQELIELAENAEEESDDGGFLNQMTSPDGKGGVVGRLLAKLVKPVRQISGGDPPGGQSVTHWSRDGKHRNGGIVRSSTLLGAMDNGPTTQGEGTKYPEWDVHKGGYRYDWCTVRETEPDLRDDALIVVSDEYGLRRPLARLGMGLDSVHRQYQGDDIDIDAVVEAQVQAMAGASPEDDVYLDSLRRRRDFSVLVLLDISGSAAEAATHGQTVHEQQRAVAAALVTTLHELGDRVSLFAFSSQGRGDVTLFPVKRFHEHLDPIVMRRLSALEPNAYSRLGAAIRHGTTVLKDRGGTMRRLLVVISDGLAYDHGYEPTYGAADARRALSEARRAGVGCLCLTVGANTDGETLRRVFGSAAHAIIPTPPLSGRVIAPLFRAALRSAEMRRRI